MRSRKVPKFVMRFRAVDRATIERRYPRGIEKFRRWFGAPEKWGPKEWELVAHRRDDKNTAATSRLRELAAARRRASERARASAREPRRKSLKHRIRELGITSLADAKKRYPGLIDELAKKRAQKRGSRRRSLEDIEDANRTLTDAISKAKSKQKPQS